MTNKIFTASNGVSVMIPIEDPHEAVVRVVFEDEGGRSLRRFNADELSALREFSLHERDMELGRWRWPENPDYVVYPQELEGVPGKKIVRAVNESTGRSVWYSVADFNLYGDDDESALATAAYLAAHPEPRPWHDAKPGEVWSAYLGSGRTAALSVMHYQEEGIVFMDHFEEEPFELTDPSITTAHRVYQEVADD